MKNKNKFGIILSLSIGLSAATPFAAQKSALSPEDILNKVKDGEFTKAAQQKDKYVKQRAAALGPELSTQSNGSGKYNCESFDKHAKAAKDEKDKEALEEKAKNCHALNTFLDKYEKAKREAEYKKSKSKK